MGHFTLLALLCSLSFISAQDIIPCTSKGRGRNSPSLKAQFFNNPNTTRLESRAAESYEIATYVHVITTTAKQDNYPISMVQDQIEVMDKAYSPSFNFTLMDADFTVNDRWATDGTTDDIELEFKTQLKKGKNYGELDLYFLSDLTLDQGSTLLGVCYMPGDNPSSEDIILDGCTNLADTMPGGTTPQYNLGATAVHETGHWLGLYHTFEGYSCSGQGDYVSDTPQQKASTEGCPASQDTCPGSPGLDGIYNYMDYSWDSCLSEFTALQRVRMLQSYSTLRLDN